MFNPAEPVAGPPSGVALPAGQCRFGESSEPVVAREYSGRSLLISSGVRSKRRELCKKGFFAKLTEGWCWFVTLTLNQMLFASPEEAYVKAMDHLHRFSNKLESEHGCTTIRHCWKLEFHRCSPYPHFHLLIWCDGPISRKALKESWGLGRVHVGQVESHESEWVFKYITKRTHAPAWFTTSYPSHTRFWQTSRGFYDSFRGNRRKAVPVRTEVRLSTPARKKSRPRVKRTILEQLNDNYRRCTIRVHIGGSSYRYHTFKLKFTWEHVRSVLEIETREFGLHKGELWTDGWQIFAASPEILERYLSGFARDNDSQSPSKPASTSPSNS